MLHQLQTISVRKTVSPFNHALNRLFYFTSPQPFKPKEASDSDFTIEDVMLWPGMRFLHSQCKRCSAGRLHLHQSNMVNVCETSILHGTKENFV